MEETQLYRHFNKEGQLLYVGISLSTINRLGQHADHAGWFKSIANITIESFPTRAEALEAERDAIIKENPLHNIMHKGAAMRMAAEAIKKDRYAKSKEDLIKRYVEFKPLYTLSELAEVLPVTNSTGTIRRMIENKELGHVVIKTLKGKDRQYVTGWQLIDYIENLEKGNV